MTLTFDTIRLFELLKPRIGAEESKAVVEALEQIPAIVKSEVSEQLEVAKKEIASKGDILSLRDDLRNEMQGLRQDILKLEIKMQEKFNSTLIWLMTTILGTAGIILAVIKLF